MTHATPTNLRCHRMSLVEIIVAMSILIIIMWVITRSFYSTQQVYSQTQKTISSYEDARLALDIIARDLQGLVVSDIEGETIRYSVDPTELQVAESSGDEVWRVALVSTSGIGVPATANDQTIEVGYFLKPDGDGDDTKLYRKMTTIDHSSWNFHDTDISVWAASGSWESSGDGVVVAENVVDFTVEALEDFGSPATANNRTPSFFLVKLLLGTVDNSVAASDSDVRTFTKTVFLRGE